MSDGWEITTKSKTKYVLEWEETRVKYSYRDDACDSVTKNIIDFKFEDVKLVNYQSHGIIKAPVAV